MGGGETELDAGDYAWTASSQRMRHNIVEKPRPSMYLCVSMFLLCGVVCDVTLTSPANIQLDPHPNAVQFPAIIEQTQRFSILFHTTVYCLFYVAKLLSFFLITSCRTLRPGFRHTQYC